MGIGDKIKNTTEDMTGKAKEAFGKATDNEKVQADGQKDQLKSDAKQVGENVKDQFKKN